jgi:hypothetical protein
MLRDCVKIPGAVVVFQHSFHATTSACFIASINCLTMLSREWRKEEPAAAELHSSHKQSPEIQFTIPPVALRLGLFQGLYFEKTISLYFTDMGCCNSRPAPSNRSSEPVEHTVPSAPVVDPAGAYARTLRHLCMRGNIHVMHMQL